MEALLALGTAFMVFGLLVMVFMIIALWFLFVKAGEPGWAAIIPIYNILIWLKVAGKPWWWIFAILLNFIPVVGSILVLVWAILVWHGISKNFGKDAGYTVGLVLLPFVFVPILAWGDAVYQTVTAGSEAPEPESPPVESEEPKSEE